jgi:hypothetical protein
MVRISKRRIATWTLAVVHPATKEMQKTPLDDGERTRPEDGSLHGNLCGQASKLSIDLCQLKLA